MPCALRNKKIKMANDELNIVVLLRACRDPRPAAGVKDGGIAIKERDVRTMLNPSDLGALEKALQLKDKHGGRLTVLAMGSQEVEDHLRTGLSMGGDRAVRISDRVVMGYDDAGMSRVLSRAFDILAADVICTGNMLEDRGFDAIFPLAAARSNISCVQNVLTAEVQDDGLQIFRATDHGARQRVKTPIPAALTFTGVADVRYPGIDALVEAENTPIEVWGTAELGLTHMAAPTTMPAGFGTPRPDPVRVVTPDPNLPAFDRILALLSGGVTARQGEVHHLGADETADELMALFKKIELLS
jgi:electron transfer flavoprotein beta subunit